MTEYFKTMFMEAKKSMENAHAPYSKFKVGACLRGKEGQLYSGCNVENASYSNTLCAEAVCVGKLASAGERTITDILIVTDRPHICAPCGSCRQQLNEFATPETLVHLCNLDGKIKTLTMKELLPFSFSAKSLEQ
jgi:cytidine deaminase